MQAGAPLPVKPSPSCLSDASVLVAAILRYAQSAAEVQRMRIEPLLRVWANFIADWSAWGEHEDKAVFDCIDELIELQVLLRKFKEFMYNIASEVKDSTLQMYCHL